ncbi:MAG: hypothetical protein RLZZ618_3094 [Pseudomonadota bacterium]
MTHGLPTEIAVVPLPPRTQLETQPTSSPTRSSTNSSTAAAPRMAGPRGGASRRFFIPPRASRQRMAGAMAATSCQTPSRALNSRAWPAVAVPAWASTPSGTCTSRRHSAFMRHHRSSQAHGPQAVRHARQSARPCTSMRRVPADQTHGERGPPNGRSQNVSCRHDQTDGGVTAHETALISRAQDARDRHQGPIPARLQHDPRATQRQRSDAAQTVSGPRRGAFTRCSRRRRGCSKLKRGSQAPSSKQLAKDRHSRSDARRPRRAFSHSSASESMSRS